jgi:hypothetical protein
VPEAENENQGIPENGINAEDAPDLSEEGRVISKLMMVPPEGHIIYSDLVRVAMDKQGMTQIQFGINDPYDREIGVVISQIYLGPRAMALLMRQLFDRYKGFREACPKLADELAMPQLEELFGDQSE